MIWEEIIKWRDALLTQGRINGDGWVYSDSLKAYVYLTSKQVIACLDAIISENPTPPIPLELKLKWDKLRDIKIKKVLNELGIVYIKVDGDEILDC